MLGILVGFMIGDFLALTVALLVDLHGRKFEMVFRKHFHYDPQDWGNSKPGVDAQSLTVYWRGYRPAMIDVYLNCSNLVVVVEAGLGRNQHSLGVVEPTLGEVMLVYFDDDIHIHYNLRFHVEAADYNHVLFRQNQN